jgi:hypothetical protein
MRYPLVELNNLRQLLEKFHFGIHLDHPQLDLLNGFIFDPEPVEITTGDRHLRETIFYLRDLAKLNSYTCADELNAFYEHKINEMHGFIQNLTSKTDAKEEHRKKKSAAKKPKRLPTTRGREGFISRVSDYLRTVRGVNKNTPLHWPEESRRQL